jgi:hypothetical protein
MTSDIVVLKVLQAIQLSTTTSNWAKDSAAGVFRYMSIKKQRESIHNSIDYRKHTTRMILEECSFKNNKN